jgi:GTPase involved in cell partitioning and DNA repair
MTGRSAENLIIPVPPGTMVYDATSNELLGDLWNPTRNLLFAKVDVAEEETSILPLLEIKPPEPLKKVNLRRNGKYGWS